MKLHQHVFLLLVLSSIIGVYSAKQFLWVSDIHFQPDYQPSCSYHSFCRTSFHGRECQKTEHSFEYGQIYCDTPSVLVDSALDDMKAAVPDPEFIIMSGDFAMHHAGSINRTLEQIQNVTNRIIQRYPHTMILPLLGNNDVYPDFQFGEKENDYLSKVYQFWKTLLPAFFEYLFTDYGYYTVSISREVRVVVLDTLLYSPRNQAIHPLADPDPARQFHFLRSTLDRARTHQESIIIVGHVPPGENSYDDHPLWEQTYVEQYLEITRNFSEVILVQLFGHLHKDTFRLLYDDDQTNALSLLLVAPSISPSNGDNPAYTIFTYDNTTTRLSLTDRRIRYMDLAEYQNNGADPRYLSWHEEYSFTSLYNQSRADLHSHLNLLQQLWEEQYYLERIESGKPPATGRYQHCLPPTRNYTLDAECFPTLWNFVLNYDQSAFKTVNLSHAHGYLCGATYLTRNKFQECYLSPTPIPPSPHHHHWFTAEVAVALAFFFACSVAAVGAFFVISRRRKRRQTDYAEIDDCAPAQFASLNGEP